MAEGPWAGGAYRDAYEVGRFLDERPNPNAGSMPQPLTSGPFDPSLRQDTTPLSSDGQPAMMESSAESERATAPEMIEVAPDNLN